MSRRIIGQCHKSDFTQLAHISDLLHRGEEVDLTNLTNRQKVAIRVIEHFMRHNIPLKTLTKIKEILVWEMDDGGTGFEYKLTQPRDQETLRVLRSYR